VVIAVRGAQGVTGLGEAAPLPGFSKDTLADAKAAVTELGLRIPLDLTTPGSAGRIASRVTTAPAARFAIETALLSAYGQRVRTSVAQLLSPLPQAELLCAVVVDDADEAQEAITLGARCLKIKEGCGPGGDIGRVHVSPGRAARCRPRPSGEPGGRRGRLAGEPGCRRGGAT